MPAFLRLALDENLHALNGVFLIARSIVSMRRRAAIIAYDISSNRRRRRVRRRLQAWSLDSQYSVFECLLAGREAEELLLQLTELIDVDSDKLLFVWLDHYREPRALTRGANIAFGEAAIYHG